MTQRVSLEGIVTFSDLREGFFIANSQATQKEGAVGPQVGGRPMTVVIVALHGMVVFVVRL
jgi:hypothetical protein